MKMQSGFGKKNPLVYFFSLEMLSVNIYRLLKKVVEFGS